jgi:hypothetical protein
MTTSMDGSLKGCAQAAMESELYCSPEQVIRPFAMCTKKKRPQQGDAEAVCGSRCQRGAGLHARTNTQGR